MQKVSIHEAAQRLGVDESVIRDWIQRGLLQTHTHPASPDSALPSDSSSVATLDAVVVVDCEQLYQVAEEQGWLLLTAEAWNDDESES